MKIFLTQEQKERIDQDGWLTDMQRTVFELYYRRGWTIEDVAAETGRDRRTVSRILRQLREKVK